MDVGDGLNFYLICVYNVHKQLTWSNLEDHELLKYCFCKIYFIFILDLKSIKYFAIFVFHTDIFQHNLSHDFAKVHLHLIS